MLAQSHIDSTEQANVHHLVLDIAWFGIALAATSRFLSVYAIRLGATPLEQGLIQSLPALAMLISSIFGTWWLSRYRSPVRALFWPTLFWRLTFILPVFAPLFPAHLQAWWVIGAATVPALLQGVAGTVFLVLMRATVYDHHMTPLFSRRSLWLNIAIGVAALAFGLWLEAVVFPLNYQVMFIVAFGASLLSMWHCMALRPLPNNPIPVAVSTEPLLEAPAPASRSPWGSHSFRHLALVTAVVHFGMFSITAIIPLHLVENLGASEGFIALFGTVELSFAALASLVTTRIAARVGLRSMIALGMLGTAVAAAIIALAPNVYFTLIAAALTGATWTMAGTVGIFAYFNRQTKPEELSSVSASFHQVIGATMFLAPLLGGLLANNGVSLVTLLLLGAAMRLLAALTTEFAPHPEETPSLRTRMAARILKP